jgi:putative transposase
MEKKESYHHSLPHFQQPGQAYFVTWSLNDAIPPKALVEFTDKLHDIHAQILILNARNGDPAMLDTLKLEFNLTRKKYLKAFDDLLHLQEHPIVNLAKDSNRTIVMNALEYWEGKRIENYAYCIMSNHVHWVFRVFHTDEKGNAVYLQDILQSVKRYSATLINKIEGVGGSLWQKESYDTTIRNDIHLYNAIDYTINNPVKAGLVTNWYEWKGTRLFDSSGEIY